jgi:DNA-binding response OmpR family regulator
MRVLLIEDNVKPAASLEVSLVQQGYSVDLAGTAEEGDEMAVVQKYDVIVLDAVLPDRDGVALCRELRRQKVSTPILMLSVFDSLADKVAGLNAGADDYLTKPFHTEELMARLRSLLRRSQAIESVVLRAGDLVMNLAEHRVLLAGVSVKLSAKEFALLEYMMRNQKKLLTRTMISESVWDMNYEASSNVIDVYVSSLRRKIDRGARKAYIETVIGSGYRFLPHADEDQAPAPPTAT